MTSTVDSPIPPPGRRSAESSTLTSAPRVPIALLCTIVGLLAVGETTKPSPALEGPLAPGEDRNMCTPLRRSSFERELANHPDKVWVSLPNGVPIRYNGPQFPNIVHNLVSAATASWHSRRGAQS